MTKTIMLIHGAWLTPASWERFRGHYEARGYSVVAPAWPYLDRPIADLRADPDKRLGKLGLKQIVDHYETQIRALPEQPILMGHSFGGLIVQLLLDRGLGAAGVAIDPGAPFGVLAPPLAVWTSRKVFTSWNAWNRVFSMSFAGFKEGFANNLAKDRQRAEYEAQIVPSPGRIFYQAVLGIDSKVTWNNPKRPPLLVVAGEDDRTVPTSMARANYGKQRRAPSPTAFKEFRGRCHYLCNEPGWEEVADYALDWAQDTLRLSTRPALAAVA